PYLLGQVANALLPRFVGTEKKKVVTIKPPKNLHLRRSLQLMKHIGNPRLVCIYCFALMADLDYRHSREGLVAILLTLPSAECIAYVDFHCGTFMVWRLRIHFPFPLLALLYPLN